MKNSLKMIPVVAGITLALLGTVDEVKASSLVNSSTNGIYCEYASGMCIVNSNGTVFHGRWNEGG